jgi:hypothetical protein
LSNVGSIRGDLSRTYEFSVLPISRRQGFLYEREKTTSSTQAKRKEFFGIAFVPLLFGVTGKSRQGLLQTTCSHPPNHKDLGSDCCLTCLSPGTQDTLRALRPSQQHSPEDDL